MLTTGMKTMALVTLSAIRSRQFSPQPIVSRSMKISVDFFGRPATTGRTNQPGVAVTRLADVTGGRELSWDGCVNVRDLGGLGQVRPGAVVRMEAPTRLSEAGWAAVWAYGVRTVVDLRYADECVQDSAPRPAGITTVQVPLDPVGTPFYEHWEKIDNLASPLYFPAMLAEHPELVVTAVRAIANAAPGCVVFHCAGGKDRTGLLALVLLTLAGAAPEEIIADYLLTYDRMRQRYDELGFRDQLTAVTEVLASHNTTIEASLRSTIGSLTMPALLLDNGLSDTELAALHTRLTT